MSTPVGKTVRGIQGVADALGLEHKTTAKRLRDKSTIWRYLRLAAHKPEGAGWVAYKGRLRRVYALILQGNEDALEALAAEWGVAVPGNGEKE